MIINILSWCHSSFEEIYLNCENKWEFFRRKNPIPSKTETQNLPSRTRIQFVFASHPPPNWTSGAVIRYFLQQCQCKGNRFGWYIFIFSSIPCVTDTAFCRFFFCLLATAGRRNKDSISHNSTWISNLWKCFSEATLFFLLHR